MKTAPPAVVVATLAALLLGGSGCSSEPKAFKVTGDCALGDDDYLPMSRILSEKTMRHLVGPGTYKTTAGFIEKHDKLPAAYDGHCYLVRAADGQNVLELATINAKDPRYNDGKELLASGDSDGFERLDAATYRIPTSGERSVKVVRVLPERAIVFTVVRPAKGVDAGEEAGPAIDRITDFFQARQGAWDAP